MMSSFIVSYRQKSNWLLLVPILAFLLVYPTYGLNIALPISFSGSSNSIRSSRRSNYEILRKKYITNQPFHERRSFASKQFLATESSDKGKGKKFNGGDDGVDDFVIDPKFLERNKYWIVLVDDEESIRLAVGDYLYNQGYQITACEDADAFLELCCVPTNTITTEASTSDPTNYIFNNEQEKSSLSSPLPIRASTLPSKLPDLIVCDIRMPGKDGIELLKIIRNDESLRYIPFVLLTAKAMTQDRIRGYKAGANAYLPKPFYPEELLSIVDNTLTRKKQIFDRRFDEGGYNNYDDKEDDGTKKGIIKKTSLI